MQILVIVLQTFVLKSGKEKAPVGVQPNEMLIEQWVNGSISAAGVVLRSSVDKRTVKMWSSLH